MDCVSCHVPLSTICSDPFILPHRLRMLEGEKTRAFRRFGPCSPRFRSLQRKYSRKLSAYLRSTEDEVLNGGQLKFYSFMNSKLKRREGIPDLLVEGHKVCSDNEKASCFATYFSSVYTRDNNQLSPFPLRTRVLYQNICFTPTVVQNAIKKMKPKMSIGSDHLPAFFYKKLSPSLSLPLSLLFRFSFLSGEIPFCWKSSSVIPVFKKGPKNLVSNYRPISKQATVLKIMEQVVIGQLITYLNSHKLLTPKQFGFRAGFSVTKQLLSCLDNWTRNYNCGTNVVFLDFTKAFDTVSHEKILFKLESYGISGLLHTWFKTYLSNRVQRVQINSSYSDFKPITSGILQGSCAGPILFLLFINDLPDSLENVEVALFADDVKLYSTDPDAIQKALHKISSWCNSWQLSLAEQKCSYIRISSHMVLPPHPFRVNGEIIQHTALQRDLGVIFTSDLDFKTHISTIIKKANRASYHVLKCFSSNRYKVMAKAFVMYVRPILESFSQVWNPSLRSDIEAIERVQHKFTSSVFFKCGLPKTDYTERLAILGLESLESRRNKLDLTLTHELYHNSSNPCANLLNKHVSRRPLREKFRLNPERKATGPRAAFFTNRVTKPWNKLPHDTITTSNKSFKKKI